MKGFKYISLRSKNYPGHHAKVNVEDFKMLSRYHWNIRLPRNSHTFYAYTTINRKSVSMHKLIMETPSGMMIDHINRNGLDNRRENLRICNHMTNMQNRRTRSGIPGCITRATRLNNGRRYRVWRARIVRFGKEYEVAKCRDRNQAIENLKRFVAEHNF